MKDFYSLIKETNRERMLGAHLERKRRDQTGVDIYYLFCAWCNCSPDGDKKKKSPKAFADFLKAENISLTFWQRKMIAETYFGYSFKYDMAKGEWVIGKQK